MGGKKCRKCDLETLERYSWITTSTKNILQSISFRLFIPTRQVMDRMDWPGIGTSRLTRLRWTLSSLKVAPHFHGAPCLLIRGAGSRWGVGLGDKRHPGERGMRENPLPPAIVSAAILLLILQDSFPGAHFQNKGVS